MDGSKWIDAFLTGELSEEEQIQFQAWLEESLEHVDQFATACLLDNQLTDIVGQRQLQKNVVEISRISSAPPAGTGLPAAPSTSAVRASFWRGLAQDFAREPMALAMLLLVMISGGVLFWNLPRLSSPPGEPRASARGGGAASHNPLNSPVDPEPDRTAQTPLGANAPESPDAPSSTIIARLKQSVDAKWNESAQLTGNELRVGQRLILSQGLAEIAFATGAVVVLEGPAELEVGSRKSDIGNEGSAVRVRGSEKNPTSDLRPPTSDNSCSLTLGKVVARVPKQAHGFTVHTPTHDIVDLGTEFAVSVKSEVGDRKSAQATPNPTSDLRPPTSTEVQVFQGEVTVTSNVDHVAQAPAPRPQVLRAGQGVVAGSGIVAPRFIAADPAKFVREMPADGIAAAKPKREPSEEPGASAHPLTPGDVLAVSRYSLKLVRIDARTGQQTLLAQGERGAHGTDWMCVAVDARQRVLIGVGGLGLVPDGGGGVVRFDPQSGKLDVLVRGGVLATGRINSLAVAANGSIFATLDGPQDQIIRIDPETGEAKSVVLFGRDAWGIAIDSDGRSVLAVSDSDGGQVARVQGNPDVQGGNVESWAKGGMIDGARGIAVLPGGRVLVSVSYGGHAIVEIDRQNHHPTRLGTLTGEPAGILGMLAAEMDGNLIVGMYLSDAGNVYRFDVAQKKFSLLSSKGHLAHCGGVAVVPGEPAGKRGEQP